MKFKLKIGLEVHVELKTEHKLFCNCKNMFGQKINSLCCPVCMGKENALPRFNNEVISPALKAAKILNCKINTVSSFDRKHYTYPDLPKGYQITQRFKPIAENGYLITNNKKVRITEMHIEEDAGKLIYDKYGNYTVDHNRCGVPLIEIVTEPDIANAKEAVEFLKNLRLKLLYAGVSDCKMQEGSMRCDVNISVGGNERTEIKNASSFKYIEKAINYESERQKELINQGKKIERLTLKIDETTGKTIPMRDKETAQDYNYIPEPDIKPLILSENDLSNPDLNDIKNPDEIFIKYTKEFKIAPTNAADIISKIDFCTLLEQTITISKSPLISANIITSELFRYDSPVISYVQLAEISNLLYENKINKTTANKVITIIKNTTLSPVKVIQENKWFQINDCETIKEYVLKAIENNKNAADDYKKGNKSSIGPILGQISKDSNGLINQKIASEILLKSIN